MLHKTLLCLLLFHIIITSVVANDNYRQRRSSWSERYGYGRGKSSSNSHHDGAAVVVFIIIFVVFFFLLIVGAAFWWCPGDGYFGPSYGYSYPGYCGRYGYPVQCNTVGCATPEQGKIQRTEYSVHDIAGNHEQYRRSTIV